MKGRGSKILVRMVTAGVLLPTCMVLIWKPELRLMFALFIGALTALGLYEYYAIVRARMISPETIGGILAGTAVALSGYFGNMTLTNCLLFGGCTLVSALHIVRGQHSVAGLASTVFGVFYVGWFGAHITLLHSVDVLGAGLVTTLFVAVILTDTAAFFVGSAIGKHKLAPKVSPNKSWEGAIAGFCGAVAGMIVLYGLRQKYGWEALPDWGVVRYAHAGAIVSIVSQLGDLTESCLKRDAGVKDSGGIFPGHGGVLDRADGFLFASPVLYYLMVPLFTV
jgi:phosphatidate cytidylyltransferase